MVGEWRAGPGPAHARRAPSRVMQIVQL